MWKTVRGGGFQMPGGRGGLGIGTIIIVGLVGWALGINPVMLISGLEALQGGGTQTSAPQSRAVSPNDPEGKFVSRVLAQTEDVWTKLFRDQGKDYVPPHLVLFSGRTSPRAAAPSRPWAVLLPGGPENLSGPFLLHEMKTRFKAPGDFAAAYVIAHEVGHHVQNVIGILPKLQAAQRGASTKREANGISVRTELMADCLAGVWAYHANEMFRTLEPGDVEEALNAPRPSVTTACSDNRRARWFRTASPTAHHESGEMVHQGAEIRRHETV